MSEQTERVVTDTPNPSAYYMERPPYQPEQRYVQQVVVKGAPYWLRFLLAIVSLLLIAFVTFGTVGIIARSTSESANVGPMLLTDAILATVIIVINIMFNLNPRIK